MNNISIDATTPNNIANCNEYEMPYVTYKGDEKKEKKSARW